jgi:hypothetical protein
VTEAKQLRGIEMIFQLLHKSFVLVLTILKSLNLSQALKSNKAFLHQKTRKKVVLQVQIKDQRLLVPEDPKELEQWNSKKQDKTLENSQKMI